MSERLLVWLRNARHAHERVMQRYLERRGWVVFYLDPPARSCNTFNSEGCCWLHLYESEKSRKEK